MTRTFIRGALQGFIFGPLSAFLTWVLMSALLSMTVWVISILLNWDGLTQLSFNQLINWDTSTLTTLPYFQFLDWVQIMWAGLLVPVMIAGGFYVIVLAQGSDPGERIVDFFDVAKMNIILAGLAILFWLIGGTWWAFTHDAAILDNLQAWQSFQVNATQGLTALGMDKPMGTMEMIMHDVYPYVMFPFFTVIYIYLFANIHAGWIGNAWSE